MNNLEIKQENAYSRVTYIDEMEQEDQAVFRRMIELSSGVINIIIHPFYKEVYLFCRYAICQKDNWHYMYSRRELFSSYMESGNQSLLVMEEKDSISELVRMSQIRASRKRLFALRTFSGVPDPFIGYSRNTSTSENWGIFAKLLDDFGVKQCILSGRFLRVISAKDSDTNLIQGIKVVKKARKKFKEEHINTWLDTNQSFDLCVGITAYHLALCGFDVSFSQATFPDKFKL